MLSFSLGEVSDRTLAPLDNQTPAPASDVLRIIRRREIRFTIVPFSKCYSDVGCSTSLTPVRS
jgi:hypothetical protein